ncbi:cytochrome c oxidase subunit 6b-1 [Quercus lobata]|uniref:cytochrome c oxidase subunit 6b-1 n=1 Tax=Quercus lobata TaxID=97700 RepID=UPI001244CC34|nr:cytochrome c oxidase subunit 6b-1 [Quercus lobata]
MAEPQSDKTPTLSEHYHLKEKEKPDVGTKSVEVKEVEKPVNAASDEVVSEKAEGSPAAAEESTEVTPVATEESTEVNPAVGESTEANSAAVENNTETAPAATEASSENSEEENAGEQEAVEETPEIKLETAPADFRFPTTNQTRHCFTRYIEYHRCIAAKGEGAPECDKFSKYYRALCPGEWVDRWNEQRENGTFPGPL